MGFINFFLNVLILEFRNKFSTSKCWQQGNHCSICLYILNCCSISLYILNIINFHEYLKDIKLFLNYPECMYVCI